MTEESTMAGRRRLTLLVEGEGDVRGAQVLINRLLVEHGGTSHLYTDEPMRVGDLFALVHHGNEEVWLNRVRTVAKRRELAGVLLLVDGDCDQKTVHTSEGKKPFCAATMAAFLAARARTVGAGTRFSLTTVFARQEYESWLIGGIPKLSDMLKLGAAIPQGDLESAPRGAKEWLRDNLKDGYKPTRHQAELTRHIDLELLRKRMRSFLRLEHAVQKLIEAARSDRHIVSPGT
ncbi:MAG: DUF4276 family protein [Verrucomicrobia bacterium]|nr:DUF4276 family protein [Verrucomicrobiota bacterium]